VQIPVLNASCWKFSYQELHYFNFHLSFIICVGAGLHMLPFASLLCGCGGGNVAGSVLGSSKRSCFGWRVAAFRCSEIKG
jgi:hypothetical protein